MIARLSGTIIEKSAQRVVVDVQGVGYEVRVPLSTFYELGGEGTPVTLETYTYVKEDILALFGFQTAREKELFQKLILISGIGPKLAITILSGLPLPELIEGISRGDSARLSRIPGVGKKTAERMILELQGKLADQVADMEVVGEQPFPAVQRDVVSALVNLGYPKNIAEKAVVQVADSAEDDLESLLRAALKRITG